MPMRQSLEMLDRYRFHSTRPAPWNAGWRRAERPPQIQERSQLQTREATIAQWLDLEVMKGERRSLGPNQMAPASFLGTPPSFAAVAVRYAGAATCDIKHLGL